MTVAAIIAASSAIDAALRSTADAETCRALERAALEVEIALRLARVDEAVATRTHHPLCPALHGVGGCTCEWMDAPDTEPPCTCLSDAGWGSPRRSCPRHP